MPGLDARPEDVPLLARHLVLRLIDGDTQLHARFCADNQPRFAAALVRTLVQAPPPTHARGLSELLLRAMADSPGATLDLAPETVMLLDQRLREIDRFRTDSATNVLESPWLVSHARGELTLIDPRAPGQPRWRGPAAVAPARAIAVDLAAATDDLLIGFLAPTRGFYRLSLGTQADAP